MLIGPELNRPAHLLSQLLFEKHRPPAVFMAKNAVLSSFASGRQTSVIVDIGHESTTGAHTESYAGSVKLQLVRLPVFELATALQRSNMRVTY